MADVFENFQTRPGKNGMSGSVSLEIHCTGSISVSRVFNPHMHTSYNVSAMLRAMADEIDMQADSKRPKLRGKT